MRGVKSFFIFLVFFAVLTNGLQAGTYTLTDGKKISGDPIAPDQNGIILKSGSTYPPRTPWTKFTQDSLKKMSDEKPQFADFIKPLLDEEIVEPVRKEIVVKPVDRPERPTRGIGMFALFVSPLGLVIFLILYAANLYAGYEIAIFKGQPVKMACGVAAVAPLVGPLIFLCLPSQYIPSLPAEDISSDESTETVEEAPVAPEESPAAEETSAPVYSEPEPVVVAPPPPRPVERPKLQPALKLSLHEPVAPAPVSVSPVVTFKRGEFTFNRRFFETKMPGFFRVVPSEAEKDLLLYIKAARGEFIGKRISRVTQTELYLQVFKEEASSDEMIPFTEIQEVQIRHKDVA